MPHSHQHQIHSNSTKNISTAFILNAVFVIIELIGGILTNSISILSDALHDFGDCISLAITWGLNKKAEKGSDAKYSYGYKRFTLLGSIFLGGILFFSSIFVIKEAITRLLHPQPIDASGMLWLAIIGVLINGIAAYKLSKGNSFSQRAVFLHMMEDLLGWVAILFSSIAMHFWDIPILDSILSVIISIWVLYHVWKNLKQTFTVMLQCVPENIDQKTLTSKILKIKNVISLHDMHLWSLDGESHVMTLHLVVENLDASTRNNIKQCLRKIASEQHIVHVTHELELKGDSCSISYK